MGMLDNALYAALTKRTDMSQGLGGGYLGSMMRSASNTSKPFSVINPPSSPSGGEEFMRFTSSQGSNPKLRNDLFSKMAQQKMDGAFEEPRFFSRLETDRQQKLSRPGGFNDDLGTESSLANARGFRNALLSYMMGGAIGGQGIEHALNFVAQKEDEGYAQPGMNENNLFLGSRTGISMPSAMAQDQIYRSNRSMVGQMVAAR